MAQGVDFAVFDADNHLYETEDSLTRHLPSTHRDLIRFVEVRGRKKLVVRDRLTEFIPNPTFEVVARPGAHMPFYAGDNPEGRSLRELTGTPMACIPAFREPGARRRSRRSPTAGVRSRTRWRPPSATACSPGSRACAC
jgi:hypothetical protein